MMHTFAVIAVWAGVGMVVLSNVIKRRTWTSRLAPFVSPHASQPQRSDGVWRSAVHLYSRTFHRVGQPDIAVRLAQARVSFTAEQFRGMQLVLVGFGTVVVAVTAAVAPVPAGVVVVAVCVLPVTVVWVSEQLVERRKRQVYAQFARELPVVVEQLAGFLQNGVGLSDAAETVAGLTHGLVAADLARIARETAHGVPVAVSLQAWATRYDLAELHRIVAVLDTHRHTRDVGRLLADEVRELRLRSHRELLQLMMTREQQVWIPVTVATLVPGVLMLAVPFWHTLSGVLG